MSNIPAASTINVIPGDSSKTLAAPYAKGKLVTFTLACSSEAHHLQQSTSPEYALGVGLGRRPQKLHDTRI